MASCKFQNGKYKLPQEVKAHFRHNDITPERRAIAKKGNVHIDLEKSKYNFSIMGRSYEESCQFYDARIQYLDSHGNKNKRKDRVTAISVEIPVPADLPRNQYNNWFRRLADLLIKKYGEENFIEGYIHYDEEHEYRNPETMEIQVSRIHGHFVFIPEVDGKLNAKQLTLRKNMKILNREVDQMTQQEFGCDFMNGSKKKSVKSVEQLKQESEYAELFYQIDQKKRELEELEKKVRFQRNEVARRLKEIEEKERELDERELFLSSDEGKVWDQIQMLDDSLEVCGYLKESYEQTTKQLKDAPTEIPEESLMEKLVQGLKEILSEFEFEEGTTLWEYIEKAIMDKIKAAIESVQSRMAGPVLLAQAGPIREKEASVDTAVRNLKARELPLDEETYRKWTGQSKDEDLQMGL